MFCHVILGMQGGYSSIEEASHALGHDCTITVQGAVCPCCEVVNAADALVQDIKEALPISSQRDIIDTFFYGVIGELHYTRTRCEVEMVVIAMYGIAQRNCFEFCDIGILFRVLQQDHIAGNRDQRLINAVVKFRIALCPQGRVQLCLCVTNRDGRI